MEQRPKKLLDPVREAIQLKHDSIRPNAEPGLQCPSSETHTRKLSIRRVPPMKAARAIKLPPRI